MLTDNAHKISFRNKVQHPEPGIVELLGLKASQALELFEDAKIKKHLKVMEQVGLSYLTLGQLLSIPPF